MNVHISPSILGADFSCLRDSVTETEKAGVDSIHFDIMDRHFVPNLTFGPMLMKALRGQTSLPFKVHLMTENPDIYVDECIENGASLITVHLEACVHLHRTLGYIREKGAQAGVAVNPSSSLSFLPYVADVIDEVLIMTVNPGFSGQKMITGAMGKINEAYELAKKLSISLNINVDGGINSETAKDAIARGANTLVMASAFYGSNDKANVVRQIKSIPLRND